MSEPPMALMVRIDGVRWQYEEIPEDMIETAMDLGWHLIARSSELTWPAVEPSQRNPNRNGDEGSD